MARIETIEDKLIKMKRQIEEAKSKIDQTKGAIDQLMMRLKSEFGVDSVDEAKELLEKLKLEQEQLDQEISDLVKKLEQEYDWD